MEWACPGLKESVDLEYSSSRGGGLVVSCDIHRWSMKAQCSLSNRMLELPCSTKTGQDHVESAQLIGEKSLIQNSRFIDIQRKEFFP